MKKASENMRTAAELQDWLNGQSSAIKSIIEDVNTIYSRFDSMERGVSAYRASAFAFLAEMAKVSLHSFRNLISASLTIGFSEILRPPNMFSIIL